MISNNEANPVAKRNRINIAPFVGITLTVILIAVLWLFIEVGRIRIPVDYFGFETLSSQVDSHSSELTSISSEVEFNKSNINSLSTAVDLTASDIISLSGDVSILYGDLAGLSSYVSSVASLAENANTYAHNHGFSDGRLKHDIVPLSNSLTNVLMLQGVSFLWENSIRKDLPTTRQIGFIAQDVEKIYPELVKLEGNGYKSVDYSRFSPILVEAIKQQQSQIQSLQLENEHLEDRISELENALIDFQSP